MICQLSNGGSVLAQHTTTGREILQRAAEATVEIEFVVFGQTDPLQGNLTFRNHSR
jgi:hypothetical protein